MLAILEMYLEVVGRHVWSRRVQFSRTVQTSDARQKVEADVARNAAWLWHRNRQARCAIDSTVAHHSLKLIVGVGLLLLPCIQRLCKPSWGRGL